MQISPWFVCSIFKICLDYNYRSRLRGIAFKLELIANEGILSQSGRFCFEPIIISIANPLQPCLMFRRLSDGLPRDPVFPADLEQLGYFINDNDEIRMIMHPDEKFNYSIDRNERVNEMQKEAMNGIASLPSCLPCPSH